MDPISALEIAAYCQDRLKSADYRDYSLNGLQYEAVRPVETICAAVDVTLEAVEAAVQNEAQLLLVHHGLFWGHNPVPLTGRIGQIVRLLVQNDISLLAFHLPLDGHESLGNNAQIAADLGLMHQARFGQEGRCYLGVTGALPAPASLPEVAGLIEAHLATSARVYQYGAETINRLAICSGRGASENWLIEAKEMGCEAYLTGEIVYEDLLAAQHLGMNVIAAGHYQTERSGVQALGQELSLKFGLNYRFLELEGGMAAR